MNGSIHYCRNQAADSVTSCHICGIEDSIKKFVSYDLYYSAITLCSCCIKKIYSIDVKNKDTVREDIEGIAIIIKNTKYTNCTLSKCEYCGMV